MQNNGLAITKLLIGNLQAIDRAVAKWLWTRSALIEYGEGADSTVLFLTHEAVISSHCKVLQDFIHSRKHDLSDEDVDWLLKSIFGRILGRVRSNIYASVQARNTEICLDSNSFAISCGMCDDLVWSAYRKEFVTVDPLIRLSAILQIVRNARILIPHEDLPRTRNLRLVI